jgi:signal transduction histidine kinase
MEVSAPVVGTTQDEAELQAALRRLAMMIAKDEPSAAVLHAVAEEAVRQFGPATAGVIRYERDGRTTLVAESTEGPPAAGCGGRLPAAGLTAADLHTGRFVSASVGSRFTAAMPVYVDDVMWGLVGVGLGRTLPTDAERRLTELAELVATAVADEQRWAELAASRARLVATSDKIRQRIERDLHEGAQQFVITLVLRLRGVAEIPSLLPEIRTEVEDIAAELLGVFYDVRELARGVHPAILSAGGLYPALRALARRSAVPVVVDVRVDRRLPEPIEVVAYHVAAEALANTAEHGRASGAEVYAEDTGDALLVEVRDDGVGGADLTRGSGLIGLRDRTEALGGAFTVLSRPGAGTVVFCRLPVAPVTPGA